MSDLRAANRQAGGRCEGCGETPAVLGRSEYAVSAVLCPTCVQLAHAAFNPRRWCVVEGCV